MSIEFLITTLIVVISPGAGAIYTIATGLGRGGRASLWAAVFCTLGIVPHMLTAITGLAAVLHTCALAFDIIKYLGVAYLLYMAWSTLRETGAVSVAARQDTKPLGAMAAEVMLINLLNPKLSVFFFAFLPQFVPSGTPNAVTRMLELSGVFMAMTFAVFAFYGLFAAAIRGQVMSRPAVLNWMRRSFAAAFVVLGAKLALTQR
ncbi:threonine/homoserine/homoserine lactone efflux protein [Devosia subaequoris]|uniref:Threonine/homoserine/homoserine lactone efflux protein n=1 Tax=Devosia subaequoris TaxID=395930 RepID=A0A7W6INB8_9HYPH|nr:LysE family translocator [Devosia subaequoris]MBB4052775.1 threonine/homoserine/homoserine lactone efflux protein [Devosia subaequoris]MCP1209928.1 LysE family translocator [Devosia subaequoris]